MRFMNNKYRIKVTRYGYEPQCKKWLFWQPIQEWLYPNYLDVVCKTKEEALVHIQKMKKQEEEINKRMKEYPKGTIKII